MIGVSLQLEKQIVRDTVSCVPRMSQVNSLIAAIFELLSTESIVFDVINCFEVANATKGEKKVQQHCAQSEVAQY